MFYLSSQLWVPSAWSNPVAHRWCLPFYQGHGDGIVFTSYTGSQMIQLPTISHSIKNFKATPKNLQGPVQLVWEAESRDNAVSTTQERRTVARPHIIKERRTWKHWRGFGRKTSKIYLSTFSQWCSLGEVSSPHMKKSCQFFSLNMFHLTLGCTITLKTILFSS